MDRFTLDACQICTRSFRNFLEQNTPGICRGRLHEASIRYADAVPNKNQTESFSATLFAADNNKLCVAEKDIESFKREFEKAAGRSCIASIDINGEMPTEKLEELVADSVEMFRGVKASS